MVQKKQSCWSHQNGSGRSNNNQRQYHYQQQTLPNDTFQQIQSLRSVPPLNIWTEVTTSSPVTMDVSQMHRSITAVNEMKRPPAMCGSRNAGERVLKVQNIKQNPEIFKDNDYTSNYIHTGELPVNFVRNVKNPVEGYPKLQRLFHLKENQIEKYSSAPYGARVDIENIVPTLNRWIVKDKLTFDVIMIGGLTENQFIYPLLTQIPLERLCSRPGFLFIWASAQQINELTRLLNTDGWAKKFRRSEELVFVSVKKDSPYYPTNISKDENAMFESIQWHCWMCITGTVRRSTDGHLIHCNVDTDLKIENEEENPNQVVPNHIYKVAEYFSSATRRLHIIPARSGFNHPVRPRRGWVIMSPDILLDNFEPSRYKNEILNIGLNVPQDQDIESIRPKSPVHRNVQLHNQRQITTH